MSSYAFKQLNRSKILMGLCALLFLGLQVTSQIHHHDSEHHHVSDTCSVCSALSASGDSASKTELTIFPLDQQEPELLAFSVLDNELSAKQRPPARAPPCA